MTIFSIKNGKIDSQPTRQETGRLWLCGDGAYLPDDKVDSDGIHFSTWGKARHELTKARRLNNE